MSPVGVLRPALLRRVPSGLGSTPRNWGRSNGIRWPTQLPEMPSRACHDQPNSAAQSTSVDVTRPSRTASHLPSEGLDADEPLQGLRGAIGTPGASMAAAVGEGVLGDDAPCAPVIATRAVPRTGPAVEAVPVPGCAGVVDTVASQDLTAADAKHWIV